MSDVLLEKPLNIDDVVALTGLARNTIYNMINKKQIPFYKPTGGRVYFHPKEIHDFIYRGKSSADYEVKEKAEAILTGGKK